MRFLFFLFFLLCIKIGVAQEPVHYIVGADELESAHLYSVIQDKDNSVWVTSNKGLYNYNGKDFTHQLPKGIKSISLFGLTKDNNGEIYCFNLNGQIFKIVNKKAELYYTISNKYLNNGLQIIFDNRNNLLVKTSNTLLTISPEKKVLNYEKDKGFFIRKYNDTLFLGDVIFQDNLIKRFNINYKYNNREAALSGYDYEGKGKVILNGFFYKDDSCFYSYDHIGKKILKVKNGNITRYHYSFLDDERFRLTDTKDDLWFSDYSNGVYKLPKSQIESQNIEVEKWFSDVYVSGAMTDAENNVWLLTFGKGIIIIPDTPVKTKLYAIDKEPFNSISKTGSDIFVSTTESNIYKFKEQKFDKFVTLDNSVLEYFKVMPQEELIISNKSIYNYKAKKVTSPAFVKKSIVVGNSIYSATIEGLVKQPLNFKQIQYLTRKRSLDVAYDSKNDLFYTSTNVGLSVIKQGGESGFFHNSNQLYTNRLVNVDSTIWATTNQGIYKIKDEKVIDSLTMENGLLSYSISDIKYEKPYVYISSREGIQRYNTNTRTFRNITESDGLVKGIYQFEVVNDTIYALNRAGLITFQFTNAQYEIPDYKTEITQAIVNGSKYIGDKAILNSRENNIEFSFLTKTYKYQKDLKYQYQLVGFEDEPIKTRDNQHFVNYSNLPAGKYTFKVDSFIKGSKNESATITFTIKKDWYKTLLFKIIMTVFSLLIIYAIYRVRVNTVERNRNNEILKKRLAESALISLKAQMNPHFIFNTLNSIQDLVLMNDVKGVNKYLGKFSDLIRKILLSSQEQYISLDEEIEMLQLYLDLERLRFGNRCKLIFQCDIPLYEQQYIKLPSMFIQPYVENAIKHGLLHKKGEKILTIIFSRENDYLKCIVEDNGIGVDEAKKIRRKRSHTGFSTGAINDRIKLINQASKNDIILKTESLYKDNHAAGTRVTLLFPVI